MLCQMVTGSYDGPCNDMIPSMHFTIIPGSNTRTHIFVLSLIANTPFRNAPEKTSPQIFLLIAAHSLEKVNDTQNYIILHIFYWSVYFYFKNLWTPCWWPPFSLRSSYYAFKFPSLYINVMSGSQKILQLHYDKMFLNWKKCARRKVISCEEKRTTIFTKML